MKKLIGFIQSGDEFTSPGMRICSWLRERDELEGEKVISINQNH